MPLRGLLAPPSPEPLRLSPDLIVFPFSSQAGQKTDPSLLNDLEKMTYLK